MTGVAEIEVAERSNRGSSLRGGARLWLVSVGIVLWRGNLRTLRFPGLLATVAFFPLFFLVAFTGLYDSLTRLPGFPTDNVTSWYLPFTVLQAAAFSGLGAGFMTGMDLETGFFDRLLLMPAHRSAIWLGTCLMSVLRALGVSLVVFAVGLLLGARLTGGPPGVALLFVAVVGVAMMGSSFALGVMYRAQDQRVAPVFQLAIFVVLFTSTAQVPLSVSTGWLHAVARVNPATNILRLSRQAFLPGGVGWADSWGGLAALLLCGTGLAWYALRGMRRLTP